MCWVMQSAKKKGKRRFAILFTERKRKKTGLEHTKRKGSLVNARKLFLPVSFIFLKTR